MEMMESMLEKQGRLTGSWDSRMTVPVFHAIRIQETIRHERSAMNDLVEVIVLLGAGQSLFLGLLMVKRFDRNYAY